MALPDQNIACLCRSLALLLHSGVTPAQSCFLLAREDTDPLPARLGEALDRGSRLSEALEETGAFPAYVPALVRVGEATGRLEEALNDLAEHYDYRCRTARQLRQALAWPSGLLLLMLLVLGVLLVKVLPVFDRVYTSLGSSLTGPGAWLLGLGQGLQRCLPGLLALALAAAAAALVLCLHPGTREAVTALWQRRFGDRGLLRKFRNARLARALAMGLDSGLSLEASAELAQLLLQDSPGAAARCGRFREALTAGTELSRALEEAGFLTGTQGRLLAIGLDSGSGEQMMSLIAGQLEEEAAHSLEDTLSRIEPAMVLLTSLLVGGILLTVMLPLMNILSAIG